MVNRVKGNLRGVIWSDCEGYYVYLPGVFILKDVHKIPAGSMPLMANDKGEMVVRYTCGVSYFELPFFLAARPVARVRLSDPDDYVQAPYGAAVALAGFFYGFLGLYFLRRALLRHHSERIAFWVLLAVFAGTNLYHYTTKEMGMSHVYSFCLFAFLVWHLPRFYETPNWRNAALLGGALGWIVLIRPTNAVAALFVLLYHVYSWEDIKTRLRFWVQSWRLVLVAAVTGFLFLFPQLWYWHEMTGHWIYFSYGEDTFIYWNRPKIAAVLFDPQNGLFLYSPIALVMWFAIGLTWKQHRYHGPALGLILIISTYLFASWWAWWFGGAFGHRSYIEFYALLAFPLAGLFDRVFEWKKPWARWAFLAGIVFLVWYSVAMSHLYTRIGGPWDGADWRWNWDKMVELWKRL